MMRIDRSAARLAIFIGLVILPSALWGQSTLNFPKAIAPSELGLSGFAIVNPGPTNAQVTYQLYGANGQVIATSAQTIPARGQLAKLGLGASELFQQASGVGWVQATSSTTGLQGFWLSGNFATFADGAEAAVSAADLVFPLASGQTEINLTNPGTSSLTVTLRLYAANGAELATTSQTLDGHGFLQGQTSALFAGVNVAAATHVRASCTGLCAGTTVLSNYIVSPASGAINAVSAASTGIEANFPQILSGAGSGGVYTSTVGVTNLSSTSQIITFTFTPISGSPQTVTRTLPASGAIRESAQSLFDFSPGAFVDGSLNVFGSSPLTAFVASGETVKGGLTIVAGQDTPRTTMLFGHIATAAPWSTRLTLMNPGAAAATVEVYAMTPAGTLIGGADDVATARFTLGTGAKRSFLLGEVIPQVDQRSSNGGLVFVRSSLPLYGTGLLFTRDFSILSNLPPNSGITFTPPSASQIHINEVESNGGTPGDWVELINAGTSAVDISGWRLLDSDDAHTPHVLPSGSTIAAGGYLLIEEAAFGFGLGAPDSVRLYDSTGTLFETYSWTAHATTTYGRCPNGSGALTTTTSSTKGAANACGGTAPVTTIRINEVESNGGTPGDWVELINTGSSAVDLSGWKLLDSDDTHTPYVLPSGSTIAAGGYLLIEEAAFGFGLGAPDSVRLYDSTGTLYETYSWTAHATTTYGRCPNGSGTLTTTASSTKGAANACGSAPVTTVRINEVESNGGTPGDWVELINTGSSAVDLSGWRFLDNDDTHTPYVLPSGSTIAAGGYLLLEEAAFGFGLGTPDSARLYDSTGTLYETYSWTPHATTTYGRCPNGSGTLVTTASSTKGAPNACGSGVKINEVESNNGVPGDWVELYNPGTSATDISGFVFKDSDDTHNYVIPGGTSIAAGGYYLLEEAAFGFGLGAADSARLFDTTAALVDSHTWTEHATTTYGRCPSGSGAFTTTSISTKGTVNTCPGDVVANPWPGDTTIQTVDGLNIFGGNLSGLTYEASGNATPGVLWAVRNGPGSLFRLLWDGTMWTSDLSNNWEGGKLLSYVTGTGSPDTEGITFAGPGEMYVATERDNNVSGVSRNSILRFATDSAGSTLRATHEWNLTADLPVVGPNLGLEGITWIPDAFLLSRGFFDEGRGHVYNPGEYPNHGTGLFFVGVEANGTIYAYALNHVNGKFNRIATIASGFSAVMDLRFDRELNDLWAVCDDTCIGRTAILRINASGRFVAEKIFERPAQMPNLNNEGFTIAPLAECVDGRRPAFWTDDTETGGHSIRRGTVTCAAP